MSTFQPLHFINSGTTIQEIKEEEEERKEKERKKESKKMYDNALSLPEMKGNF